MGPVHVNPPDTGSDTTDRPAAGDAMARPGADQVLPRLRRRRSRAQALYWWLGALLVPAIWQIYAWFADTRLVPGPFEVAAAFPRLWETGELQQAMWESGIVFVAGTIGGTVVGLAVGGLMGRVRTLDVMLDPYMAAAYAVPSIAVIPLFIVIIGWDAPAKAIIIAVLVFFPIAINAATGVRHASRELRELAVLYSSGEYARWRDILVPSALPALLPGLRVALARALTAVIVAEFSTAAAGLGYIIQYYTFSFDVAESLVPVVVLGLVGFALYRILDYSEARLIPWALRE